MAQSGAAVGPPWSSTPPPALPPRTLPRPPPPPRPRVSCGPETAVYVNECSPPGMGILSKNIPTGVKKAITPWDSPSASSSPASSSYFSYSSTSTSPPLESPSISFNPFRNSFHPPNPPARDVRKTPPVPQTPPTHVIADDKPPYTKLSHSESSDDEPTFHTPEESKTSVIRRRATVEVRSVAVQTPSVLMSTCGTRATYPRAKGPWKSERFEPRPFCRDDENVFAPLPRKMSHSATVCEWETSFVGDSAPKREEDEANTRMGPAEDSPSAEESGKRDREVGRETDRAEGESREEEGCGVEAVAKVLIAPRRVMSRAELSPAPQIAYTSPSAATLPRTQASEKAAAAPHPDAVSQWLSELRSSQNGAEEEEEVMEEKGEEGKVMEGEEVEVRVCGRSRRRSRGEISVYEDACSCCTDEGCCNLLKEGNAVRGKVEKERVGGKGKEKAWDKNGVSDGRKGLGRVEGVGADRSSKGGWKGIYGMDGEVAEGEGTAVRGNKGRGGGIEWRLSALGLAGKEKLDEEEMKKVTEAGKGSFKKSKEQISSKDTNKECDKVPDSKSIKGSTESVDGKNGPRKDVDDKRPEVEGVAVCSSFQTPKLSQSDSFKSTSSESKLSSSSSQDIPTSVDWHGERVTPPTRPPVPPRRRKGAETPVSDGGDAVKGLQRKDLGEVDGCEDAKAETEIKAVTKEAADCIVAEPKSTEKELPRSKTEEVKVEEKVEEKVQRGVEGMKLSGKEGKTDEEKKTIKYSIGSEGTTGDGECCESELSLESTQGDEEEEVMPEEEMAEHCGEWKGVFVRGRRKGSCSSDIEAWKRGLSGWCSVEDEDDFLECTQFDPDDSQSLSVGCGSPLADPEKSVEEWYSSNDAEGRVYYFEENSHESSWTLPEVSITSPSQTPPLAGISASPMGSDSFISGRSSGGEEGLGANGHEEVDRDGGSSFALRGEPPMPKVKERQKEWEKATGGRLIQLRENTDKDRRVSNSARTTKTRSMILMDPISGEIKMPSYGKILKDWPELWDGNMCILKEGPLNRTKITENGKKVRKNWSPSHVVLTELFLLFFKDAKTFAATKAGNSGGNGPNEPAASPELCVDLSGASVERGDHLSSRRNVFLVTAILGLQVLCQDDNPQNSESWYQEILKAIRQLPSAVDGSPRQNTLERQTYVEAHSPDEHKKFPRIGRSKSVKVKKDASMEDLSVTEKQVKIRARLKKFFHRRPTMESLVKKGIWKDEPAFGCYLDQVSGEGIPRIPLFVQRCIAAIEAKPENMKADGLYRASGNLSQVQKIRLQVDQYNLEILDVEEDVHVLTGALKLFFRELKEPLIPFSLFSKALSASTNPNRKEQLSEFRELVKSLPMANYDTLKYLLQHLLRVTSYQEFNRMHIANLAIVFGPTLMWPEQESLNMALDLMQQNLVIECLLQEFDSIFLTGR